MSNPGDFRKFLDRSWPERLLVIEAYLCLGFCRLLIILMPFRKIAALLQSGATKSPMGGISDLLASISWAIQATAPRTPWQSVCLGQALAGALMLKRRGLSGTLFLGVAKDPLRSGATVAHAWLVSEGMILTGAAGYDKHAVIASYSW